MSKRRLRTSFLLTFGAALLAASVSFGASPEPCQVLTATTWGGIMGYAAKATPGEMNCTYEGANKAGGGQFRIMAVAASNAEAEATLKRMREHQARTGRAAGLSVFDSQGPVVFSINLFQHEATEGSAAQLQKLAAAAKQHLAK